MRNIFFNYFDSENHFVIVGGQGDNGTMSNVESLDENEHLICNIPSYPFALRGHSSTVTSSGILVCGGLRSPSNERQKACYEYTPNNWASMASMTTERSSFDMIFLKGKVYAVGGSGGSWSMDIFDSTTGRWTSQSNPFSIWSHCITQLSENQFLLIGGSSGVSKNVMKKNISIQQSHFLIILRKVFFTNYFLF